MQELIKALIKARGEFTPIQKDGRNPHYKTKYATLDAVLDAVTPSLSKHGLAVLQTTEIVENRTVLQTHLYHESGEKITSTYPLPDIGDSQKFGAALTYARRYSVCAILSVTADEDDDGNSTINQPKKQENKSGVIYQKPDLAHVWAGVKEEPWKNWTSPNDAIAWAVSQLPSYSPDFLQKEFDGLQATNGKKAPAWVRRVEELKREI